MGTRSTILFRSLDTMGNIHNLVNIYQQYDGYPEGVGIELAEWLLNKKLINGIRSGQNNFAFANGVGCLAAQFIHTFKTDVGGLYITDIESHNMDYNYEVTIADLISLLDDGISLNDITEIKIRCFDHKEPIFTGKPSELIEWVQVQADI